MASMADIAFLLLIFFLVTTTMDVDTGIARKLPPMPEEELQEDDVKIHDRNIYVVKVNKNNQLLVEGELLDITQLKEGAKRFISNNGLNPNLSDNPDKAIISLQNDRGTEYMTYIQVQNELAAAYNELRNEKALMKFGESFVNLNKTQQKEIRKCILRKYLKRNQKILVIKMSKFKNNKKRYAGNINCIITRYCVYVTFLFYGNYSNERNNIICKRCNSKGYRNKENGKKIFG